ncbi:hypothetical protein V1525DRAFT_341313, partial [Lipomyces kononenkoae]
GTVLGFDSEYFLLYSLWVFVLREDFPYTIMFLLFVDVYIYIHPYVRAVTDLSRASKLALLPEESR